jgi:hypothetical protein
MLCPCSRLLSSFFSWGHNIREEVISMPFPIEKVFSYFEELFSVLNNVIALMAIEKYALLDILPAGSKPIL